MAVWWGMRDDDPAYGYTYRVEWSEEQLAYVSSCVEYPEVGPVPAADGEEGLRWLIHLVSERVKADGDAARTPASSRGTLRRFEDAESMLAPLLVRVSLLAYRAKRDGDERGYRDYTGEWHALREGRETIESYEFARMDEAAEAWGRRMQELEPVAWPDPDARARVHAALAGNPRKDDGDFVKDRMERYACTQSLWPLEDMEDWELAERFYDKQNDLSAKLIALGYRCSADMDDYGWVPDDVPALRRYYRRLLFDLDDEYNRNSRLNTPRETTIRLAHQWARDNFVYGTVLKVIDPSGDSTDTWHHRHDFTEDDRQRVLAGEISMPLLRHLLTGHNTRRMLDTALRRHWPWAGPLYDLPDGWKLGLGAELVRDMQTIIDAGLGGFRINLAEARFGQMRITWGCDAGDEDTDGGSEAVSLAAAMDALLFLYQLVSIHVCSQCGRFAAMRYTREGMLPVCAECLKQDDPKPELLDESAKEASQPAEPIRDTIVYDTDTGKGTRPTDVLRSDARFRGLNIFRLMDQADAVRHEG
ncbi:hypothetical protein BMYO_0794 [Bifidobacterium myosotis]|uniref:Uncharacterized protein n=2 Tax=Bifidobacterium myosotis TaxID=1630166 RepID=A0A261FMZ1_9BIFI|nr:hypothetical protein BMYO_0794 [Bifidobacterium myosotis]